MGKSRFRSLAHKSLCLSTISKFSCSRPCRPLLLRVLGPFRSAVAGAGIVPNWTIATHSHSQDFSRSF